MDMTHSKRLRTVHSRQRTLIPMEDTLRERIHSETLRAEIGGRDEKTTEPKSRDFEKADTLRKCDLWKILVSCQLLEAFHGSLNSKGPHDQTSLNWISF